MALPNTLIPNAIKLRFKSSIHIGTMKKFTTRDENVMARRAYQLVEKNRGVWWYCPGGATC